MTRLVHGVGFNTKGKYRTKEDGKNSRCYEVWKGMIQRCYCPKSHKRHPTYIGCTVDRKWHDYQAFAEWYTNHEYYGMDYELDKDLLVVGNKVYSTETCCLVPKELNILLTNRRSRRGNYPQGVSLSKRDGRYLAQIRTNGKARFIGLFDSPSEAHHAYKIAKEMHVKKKALEWRDRIEPRVFEALMDWELSYDETMPE